MDILGIGASALVSAGQAARVRANNIVNAETPGFKPQAPVFSQVVNGGGVALFTQQANQPVNLLTETLGLKTAALQYKAAANLVRRADEMHAQFLRAIA